MIWEVPAIDTSSSAASNNMFPVNGISALAADTPHKPPLPRKLVQLHNPVFVKWALNGSQAQLTRSFRTCPSLRFTQQSVRPPDYYNHSISGSFGVPLGQHRRNSFRADRTGRDNKIHRLLRCPSFVVLTGISLVALCGPRLEVYATLQWNLVIKWSIRDNDEAEGDEFYSRSSSFGINKVRIEDHKSPIV